MNPLTCGLLLTCSPAQFHAGNLLMAFLFENLEP
jgi:hypothetical protein